MQLEFLSLRESPRRFESQNSRHFMNFVETFALMVPVSIGGGVKVQTSVESPLIFHLRVKSYANSGAHTEISLSKRFVPFTAMQRESRTGDAFGRGGGIEIYANGNASSPGSGFGSAILLHLREWGIRHCNLLRIRCYSAKQIRAR